MAPEVIQNSEGYNVKVSLKQFLAFLLGFLICFARAVLHSSLPPSTSTFECGHAKALA
jgi:hypothetical protein